MLYTQAARGFRYGGVNLPVPLQFCATVLQNAGLTNAPATFTGDIKWEADWTHRDGAYTQFNVSDPYTRSIPSSEMLNATISSLHKNWEVDLYGTNLTNNLLVSTISPVNRYVPYQPDDMVYVGRPRTIGIRLHYGF